MTHRTRFVRTLTGQEADRVPFIKVFGGTNACLPRWEAECPGISQRIDETLQFEGVYRGWQITPVNFSFANDGEPEIIEETDTRIIRKFRHGTVELLQKGDYHHQTIEWPVKDRADWERVKAEHLPFDDPSRFPANWADCVASYRGRDYPLQLTHGGVYGFARTLMGDETLAYAFCLEPDLVHEIMDYYTNLMVNLWEKMAAEVEFDLIECWEDMAFRGGSLISPETFHEFMKPNYLKIADFARRHRIPIILVDSDGYIEDLTGLMLGSGVTALYPYEVQSGNDVARVLDAHATLGVIGGLDKGVMAQGKKAIDREMDKARTLIRKGRFIPGPDHFVLSEVSWDNYRYFMERLRDVVMTTKPGTQQC